MRAHIPTLFVTLLLALVYGLTLAPGITWANQGADSGGLISAAYSGGAAHPPGYPLYLSLAWLAQRILPGEVALRTNLLSALFAILAALGLQTWLRRLDVPVPLAALGALSLGLSPLVWSQAVISEVYTLQLALTVLIFLQMSAPGKGPLVDIVRGLVFGLALANHATSLFLAPVLLFDSTPGPAAPVRRILLRFGAAGLAALALYATLFLRGASGAPVNWGRVDSFGRLWWLVRGGPYTEYLSAAPDLGAKLPQLADLLSLAGWPLLLLAALALFFVPGLAALKRLSLVVLALHLVFGLSYSTRDWQVTLLPVFLLVSLWMTLGLAHLPERLSPARVVSLRLVLSALALLTITLASWRAWPLVDASRDTRAADFAATILAEAPSDALVFTGEDRDTFSLWYYHYVLGQRPDLAILPISLLEYDWQRENLRLTYPGLVVPDRAEYNFRQAIIQANPTRPVCAILVEPQPAFMCR